MELQVKTLDGKEAGSVAVSDTVFGLEPRADIIARMVRYQQMKKNGRDAQDQNTCGNHGHYQEIPSSEGFRWRASW